MGGELLGVGGELVGVGGELLGVGGELKLYVHQHSSIHTFPLCP